MGKVEQGLNGNGHHNGRYKELSTLSEDLTLIDRVRFQVGLSLSLIPIGFLKSPTSVQQVQQTPEFGFVTASAVKKTFRDRELQQVNGKVALTGKQITLLGVRNAFEDQWSPKVKKMAERLIREEIRRKDAEKLESNSRRK